MIQQRDIHAARYGAFTIIETLAVILVMSMTVALIAVSLAGADRGANMLRLIGTVQELDCRGRLQARTSNQCMRMSIDAEQRLVFIDNASGNRIASEPITEGIELSLRVNSPPGAVLFDRQGRSSDYVVSIHSGNHVRQWNVSGSTGLFRAGGDS